MTNFKIALEKIFVPNAYAARVARREAREAYYEKCFELEELIERYAKNGCRSADSEKIYPVVLMFNEYSIKFSPDELAVVMDICEERGAYLQFDTDSGFHGFFINYLPMYEEIPSV